MCSLGSMQIAHLMRTKVHNTPHTIVKEVFNWFLIFYFNLVSIYWKNIKILYLRCGDIVGLKLKNKISQKILLTKPNKEQNRAVFLFSQLSLFVLVKLSCFIDFSPSFFRRNKEITKILSLLCECWWHVYDALNIVCLYGISF